MPHHREYTLAFGIDDYACRDGFDLSVDDLIVEIQSLARDRPDANWPDIVIWEADVIRAVIRFPVAPNQTPQVIGFACPADGPSTRPGSP